MHWEGGLAASLSPTLVEAEILWFKLKCLRHARAIAFCVAFVGKYLPVFLVDEAGFL